MSIRIAAATVLALATLSATPLPARAAEPSDADAYVVTLDLVEKNGDTYSAQIALTGNNCGKTESQRGGVQHQLRVCEQHARGSAPRFAFNVDRRQATDKGEIVQRFEVQAPLAPGKPVVIGKLSFADGSSTEIRAPLR